MGNKTFGFEEFDSGLERAKKNFKKDADLLLKETGDEAVTQTQMGTPTDTTTLLRSIARSDVSNFQVEVGSAIEYAIYVEEGTVHMKPFFMLRDGVTVASKRFYSEADKLMKYMLKGFEI